MTKGSIICHTRGESLRPKLVAHLLDLRRLCLEGCCEGLNFLLFLCGSYFLVRTQVI
jgi:hypothetical protein